MNEDECSICLEEKQDVITVLLCKHKFHKNCIDKWLKIRLTCPNCNEEVSIIATYIYNIHYVSDKITNEYLPLPSISEEEENKTFMKKLCCCFK